VVVGAKPNCTQRQSPDDAKPRKNRSKRAEKDNAKDNATHMIKKKGGEQSKHSPPTPLARTAHAVCCASAGPAGAAERGRGR